ncbi:unnamed protein product, partial [Rotaria sordida]
KSRLSLQKMSISSNTIIRQKYRIEFTRDRKSMSAYVVTAKDAPESIVERSTHMRIEAQKVPMIAQSKQEIMKLVHQYGTGRDTLHCLALETIDNPLRREEIDLENSRKFITYEVRYIS